jgi:drug/metabolite transporter (DMT)-like permease
VFIIRFLEMGGTTRGALWIILGMALIAVGDNYTPIVTEQMGLWQFHLLRSAMVIPVALIFALATGRFWSVWPTSVRHVSARSLLSMAAMVMYFAALPAVGIAQAAAGLFTSPIWVVLVSSAFYGERVSARRVVAVVIGFAGVCLVLEVGKQPIQPMALTAVGGGLAWALSVIWTRHHCLEESAICMAIWQFAALMLAGLAGLVLSPWIIPVLSGVEGTEFVTQPIRATSGWVLFVLFLIGIARISAAAFQAVGYQSGDASVVALFDLSFLFWAPFFAWMIWGKTVSLSMAAGMVLIVLAGALAIWSGDRARSAAVREDE